MVYGTGYCGSLRSSLFAIIKVKNGVSALLELAAHACYNRPRSWGARVETELEELYDGI